MIKLINYLMSILPEDAIYSSKSIASINGRYKLPENWSEFKRYITYRYKGL